MATIYTSADIQAVFTGQRVVYHGVRIPSAYNAQVSPQDMGSVMEVRDGQLIVAFDRGVRIPLTVDADHFSTM
jgi:hypothetical protein